MTSYMNDSAKIFNHWGSFKSDISASFLKSNYAKLFGEEYINKCSCFYIEQRYYLSGLLSVGSSLIIVQ